MTNSSCLTSGVSLLLSRVFRLCSAAAAKDDIHGNGGKHLPYDLIADILSRLPAELVHQCVVVGGGGAAAACTQQLSPSLLTSPSFIDMHLRRATPDIAIQYLNLCRRFKPGGKLTISFTHGSTKKKKMKKSIRVDFTSPPVGRPSTRPILFGSYHGILLIINKKIEFDSVLLLWNPITDEQAMVTASNPAYRVCAFFLHPISNEYTVLFHCREQQGWCFRFALFSLASKSSRRLPAICKYLPRSKTNPIILYGALHWILDDRICNALYPNFSYCSHSIIVFDVKTELFSTMPHPGGQCREKYQHGMLHLLEMEGGKLGCFRVSASEEIQIWMLTDYEKQVWVKTHVIRKLPVKNFWKRFRRLEAIHIYGDELLMRWETHLWGISLQPPYTEEKLFLYNMTSGKFTTVEKWDFGVSAVPHVNSLVSLNLDAAFLTMSL